MRFAHTVIESIGYELPATVVTSEELEQRLAPLYRTLHLQVGQLAALTGIRQRRYWSPKHTMAEGAIKAGRKAITAANIGADKIGMVVYAGVCRDNLEPATACAVAAGLGIRGNAQIFDISNACLGVISGIVQVAGAIELGQIQAGLIVSCESARQIVDLTIQRMLAEPDMERLRLCLATLTGGSGAIGVLVCHESLSQHGHRLLGGVIRSEPKHHQLCRWGPDTGIPASAPMQMDTDAAAVMEHGVALGIETWRDFLSEMNWSAQDVDRTICHQVGAPHRDTVLAAIGIPVEKDFQTYEFLGNIGTVSLPITAAIAEERGELQSGQRVAFLGIGSGLNCQMLGLQW